MEIWVLRVVKSANSKWCSCALRFEERAVRCLFEGDMFALIGGSKSFYIQPNIVCTRRRRNRGCEILKCLFLCSLQLSSKQIIRFFLITSFSSVMFFLNFAHAHCLFLLRIQSWLVQWGSLVENFLVQHWGIDKWAAVLIIRLIVAASALILYYSSVAFDCIVLAKQKSNFSNRLYLQEISMKVIQGVCVGKVSNNRKWSLTRWG